MNLGHFVQALFHVLTGGQQAQPQHPTQLFSKQEDGVPVIAPRGIMPLSSVNQGESWHNLIPQHLVNPQIPQHLQKLSLQPMRPQVPLNPNGAMAHQGIGYQGQYDPSMGGPARQTNPYMQSNSHSPIPSFMGNRYAQNPTSNQFLGVDPMIFGYPADNTAFNPAQAYQNIFRGR